MKITVTTKYNGEKQEQSIEKVSKVIVHGERALVSFKDMYGIAKSQWIFLDDETEIIME